MKAFACLCSWELKAGLRNRSLLLLNYLLPLGFYALVGALMTTINPFFGQQIIPAMVVFTALSSAILGLPAPLVEARETGVLRSFRVNGLSACPLLAAPALSSSVHILAVTVIITVTAPLLFAGQLPNHWAAYFLVLLSLLLACTGLGSLIGVIAGSSRSAILWQQLIYLPSMLLGGLMLPSGMLPAGFARMSRLLPATYAMDAFLGLAWGQETLYPSYLNIAILAAGGILAFALSARLFAWDNDNRKHPFLAILALLPYLLGALLLN